MEVCKTSVEEGNRRLDKERREEIDRHMEAMESRMDVWTNLSPQLLAPLKDLQAFYGIYIFFFP